MSKVMMTVADVIDVMPDNTDVILYIDHNVCIFKGEAHKLKDQLEKIDFNLYLFSSQVATRKVIGIGKEDQYIYIRAFY